MEHFHIELRDEAFDRIVHGGVAERGDAHMAVKLGATIEGRAGVALGWTAVLPDGSEVPVQCVITARLFLAAAAAVRGYLERHGEPS